MDLSEIWKANLDTQAVTILTHDHKAKFQPYFSTDGSTIAFVKSGENKSYHIWLMDADGSNEHRVTSEKGFNLSPAFSLITNQIIFSSNHNENDYDIYSVDMISGKVSNLIRHPGLDTSADFSPDGKNIVFVSNRSGVQQIWTANIDGSSLKQLTDDPSAESLDPAWVDIRE